jgi:hypothetical protein
MFRLFGLLPKVSHRAKVTRGSFTLFRLFRLFELLRKLSRGAKSGTWQFHPVQAFHVV